MQSSSLLGINRNILECKGTTELSVSPLAPGINRNILECKVRMRKNMEKTSPVLIETYWNVKLGDSFNA